MDPHDAPHLDLRPFAVVLLDIEGTIAPIAYVHEVMFPYARAHLDAFLEAEWGDAALEADLARLRSEREADAAAGQGEPLPPPGAPGLRAAAAAALHGYMDQDRKSTALKAIQGRIWRNGFTSGALAAPLFGDVPPALERWAAAGKRLAIYSSGSVEAQRLFVGHTTAGDLSGHFEAHFDTTTGPKKEADSYTRIAEALRVPPSVVLFCTDVAAEADAAVAAGCSAAILARPGNPPQPPHRHPVLESFSGGE